MAGRVRFWWGAARARLSGSGSVSSVMEPAPDENDTTWWREGAYLILGLPARGFLWFLVGLQWVLSYTPRWVPDLARFTRSDDLRQFHSTLVGWLDQNLGLIESDAPWLNRTGSWVFDRCYTSAPAKRGNAFEFLTFPRPYPQVRCEREVTAVYGFDGSLPDRLTGLITALAAAGWQENSVWTPLRDFARGGGLGELPKPPYERLRWSPVPGLGPPQALNLAGDSYPIDDGRAELAIGWISRGQPAELLSTRFFPQPGDHGPTANLDWAKPLRWPADLASANAVYRPVEISEAGVSDLAGRAVARHEHAVAIRIAVEYYYPKPAATARLRYGLRPTLPTQPL
jgi:hypothetical protein